MAIANKRKELTFKDLVGVCVIQKEITGNIPASNSGLLVLILCELFFQATFLFPAVVRIFMVSSRQLCCLFFVGLFWFGLGFLIQLCLTSLAFFSGDMKQRVFAPNLFAEKSVPWTF